MSMYLSFVIRSDSHDHKNLIETEEYVQSVVRKINQCSTDNVLCIWDDSDETEGTQYIEFLSDYCGCMDGALYDGYWSFETYYDHYVLPYNGKRVLKSCRKLCHILGQKEAWICVHDHSSNSITAPTEFQAWLKYAETFGIKELDEELIEGLDSNNIGFDFAKFIIGNEEKMMSYPIYHVKS